MKKQTVAQIILNNSNEYVSYDFDKRKERRINQGKKTMNINISKKNLLDLKNILDKHNITFWLLYGTLLGAIRDKNFIEWDTDTDIGIFDSQKSQFLEAIPEIISSGFSLIRTAYPDDLVTFMRDDEYIDVGIFRREIDSLKNSYYVYQDNREYLPSFDKLKDYKFLDFNFKVPFHYENLLIRWYGRSWRKKRKYFPAFAYNTSKFNKIQRVIKSFFIDAE